MSSKVNLVLCALFLCCAAAGCSTDSDQRQVPAEAAAHDKVCASDTFIIYFDDDFAEERISSFVAGLNGDIIYDYRNLNAVTVHFQQDLSAQYIDNLSRIEGVLSVQRDCMLPLH